MKKESTAADRHAIAQTAARARWSRPKTPTTRINLTIPVALADKIKTLAEDRNRPAAKIAQEILAAGIKHAKTPYIPLGLPTPYATDAKSPPQRINVYISVSSLEGTTQSYTYATKNTTPDFGHTLQTVIRALYEQFCD